MGLTTEKESNYHNLEQMPVGELLRHINDEDKTVAYAVEVKSYSLRIRALNNLGNVYADKGNNPLSLQYYQQALQIGSRL